MVAGTTSAPASPVRPPATASGAVVLMAASRLEDLVPPLLHRRIVLGEEAVVEILEALFLFGREADALLQGGRDIETGHSAVIAHIDCEGLLRRLLEHGVHIGVGILLVRSILRDDETGDIGRDAFNRGNRLAGNAGILPLDDARFPDRADANLLVLHRLGEGLVRRVD